MNDSMKNFKTKPNDNDNDSDNDMDILKDSHIDILLKNLAKEELIEPSKALLEITTCKCKAIRSNENHTIIILVVLCSMISTLLLTISLFQFSLIMNIIFFCIWTILNNYLAFILFYNRKTLFKDYIK